MFTNVITQTSFTSPEASLYFNDRIYSRNEYNGDVTFLSTLRALLYDRMPENDSLIFQYISNSNTNLLDHYDCAIINASNICNGFQVISNNGKDISDKDEFIKRIDSTAKSLKFERIEKVTRLFEKKMEIYCYINRENKNVVLIVPNMNIKKWHLIQCVILAVMPWYYDEGTPISDEESALLYAVQKGSDDEYLKAINAIASKINFKDEYIRFSLDGFESRYERKLLDSKREKIVNYRDNIEDLLIRIREISCQIRTEEINILGLEQKINSINNGDSEIMRFFMNSDGVDLVSAIGGKLSFICKGYLSMFDKRAIEPFLKTQGSLLFPRVNGVEKEDMLLFYKALFIDRKIKLRMCAAYELNVDSMRCRGLGGYSYGGKYDRYMPNPHIHHYSCIGTYEEDFVRCLMNYDYIGCIQTAASSALTINLNDTAVLPHFATALWSSTNDSGTTNTSKCIELPDGTTTTAVGAVEWLKANEEK